MGVTHGTIEGMLQKAHARFVSEIKSGNYEQLLRQMAFCSEYSVNNQMLLGMEGQLRTKVRTFEEWESHGRHVKKGEKAIRIVVPRPIKDMDMQNCTLAVGWVFDINQTYGQEQEPMTLGEIYSKTPQKVIDGIKAQLGGYKIQSMERTVGCDAVIDTTKREISINEGLPQDKYVKLLVQQVIIAKSLQQKRMSPKVEGISVNADRLAIDSATYAVMANLGLQDKLSKETIQELSQIKDNQIIKLKELFAEISDMTNMIVEGTLESCLSGRKYTNDIGMKNQEIGKELVA